MIEKDILIINRLGLHARAAAKFVSHATRFKADLQVTKDGRKVNGKSIMGVMMLAASKGTEVVLEVDGNDEKDCMEAIIQLINDRFDEGE